MKLKMKKTKETKRYLTLHVGIVTLRIGTLDIGYE
jgi:hypothetical protein